MTARTFVDDGRAVVEIADTGHRDPGGGAGASSSSASSARSTATEQAIPGTGLGLVISRAIAEAHGGTIGVRSAAGEGTCFRVELPLEPEEVGRLTRIVALDVGSSSVRAVAYDEEGTAEPGGAHLAYEQLDADELVDACRAVLAQVGEGDALAISCFWHSLVALDAHDRPLHAGADVARHARGAAAARPRRLPPPHRLLPASGLLAGKARSA